ncbi:hypothetical protein ACOSQ2_024359 [Xanthoceras sorbifolium]
MQLIGGRENKAVRDNDGADADFATIDDYMDGADDAGDPERASGAHETVVAGASRLRLEATTDHPPWKQLIEALQDMRFHFDARLDCQDQRIDELASTI